MESVSPAHEYDSEDEDVDVITDDPWSAWCVRAEASRLLPKRVRWAILWAQDRFLAGSSEGFIRDVLRDSRNHGRISPLNENWIERTHQYTDNALVAEDFIHAYNVLAQEVADADIDACISKPLLLDVDFAVGSVWITINIAAIRGACEMAGECETADGCMASEKADGCTTTLHLISEHPASNASFVSGCVIKDMVTPNGTSLEDLQAMESLRRRDPGCMITQQVTSIAWACSARDVQVGIDQDKKPVYAKGMSVAVYQFTRIGDFDASGNLPALVTSIPQRGA